MRTLVPDPPPAELEALLERRRRSGLDRLDDCERSRLIELGPAELARKIDWP